MSSRAASRKRCTRPAARARAGSNDRATASSRQLRRLPDASASASSLLMGERLPERPGERRSSSERAGMPAVANGYSRPEQGDWRDHVTAVMEGVRILEVAEHTFVPAASALLADWGADVIKIEHVERGDAMRGLASSGIAVVPTDVHVLLEHSNRGKRSLALDLTSAEGLEILYKIAATSDVFLTTKLPGVRKKLKIDLDDIRVHSPDI